MQKQVAAPGALGRSRPTNNQLLYKAHFRWEHYAPDPDNHLKLPLDTEACASVTAAFLKVLAILHTLEVNQQPSRNILMILANNTRRTKVLELSSGTHRIPDELKKHHLIDENGAQYSTNLDRNRYGNDNNYLFTVIKHDLETLGLCPCMVDVEIIDAKSQGDSQLVTAGLEVCSCNLGREPRGAPGADMGCYMLEPPLAAARNRVVNAEGGLGWNRGPIRSCRSENEGSQKFEALLVAADAAAEEQNEVDNLLMMNNRERRGLQPRRGGGGGFDSGDAMALRKRGPKRVHTGLFSVDTSELLGNISHLGQSGLAIADADADRGEVEQGPLKKGRTRNTEVKKDPDVNSEEGDTDARFRDDEMAMDDGTAPRHKKGIIPRRSSAIVMNHRQPQDMRRMSFELEHMRQMQMSRALDEETVNRYEEAITKLQEDVQQIKEQVHTLLASNAESNKRASTLAMELAQSRQESSSLFKLLQDLLTQPRGAVPLLNNSAAAMNLQALELPRRPGQNAGQGSELVQAPAPAIQEPEAPSLQKNAGVKPVPRARGEHVPYVSSPLRHNGSCEIRRAADAARSKQQQPVKGEPGLNMQLAPVAQLDATSGLNSAHRSTHNSEHVDTSRLTSLADVVSREDLEAMVDEQQWRNDEHEIKGLPKLGENFPSLSDLGSLFSAGQPSMELLKEIRRPPCATQSVTSPSSGMLAALNANANLADRSATKERGVNCKSTLSYSTTNAEVGKVGPAGQSDAAVDVNLQSSGNGELQDMHASPPFSKPDMPAKATEATC